MFAWIEGWGAHGVWVVLRCVGGIRTRIETAVDVCVWRGDKDFMCVPWGAVAKGLGGNVANG